MQVLIVGMSQERSAARAKLLEDDGWDVLVALGFREAVKILAAQSPDLLISEVRLGEFNGLHLVLRCHIAHPAMRTILLDRIYDSVLEFDAQRHGAAYLVEPVADANLLEQVSRIGVELTPHRRWPRKRLAVGLLVARPDWRWMARYNGGF